MRSKHPTTNLAGVVLALLAGLLTTTVLVSPASASPAPPSAPTVPSAPGTAATPGPPTPTAPATPATATAPGPTAAADCAAQGAPSSEAAGRAITAACTQVAAGTWYTWGGGHGPTPGATYGSVDPSDPERSRNDPYRIGFDCSGLVRWAWSQAVGQDVVGQKDAAEIFGLPGQRLGTDTAALLPGDLVFWGRSWVHHVAIYLGAGRIVEARESDTHLMVSDLTSHTMSDYAGAVRFAPGDQGTPPGGTTTQRTWSSGVNVRPAPSTAGTPVAVLPGPTTVRVSCQVHGQSVTAEGYTNDAWSYLPDYRGWISNIYLQGPAWLTDVPECKPQPALRS
ncbi:NlpC/P60 family protein [Kitasatospora sp. NPDC089913]|uniref:NlpC/P60 family protein n=1 Tax=Kitasatospora sp. NPDC089913 TaxID=3364080 RepID=UPI00381A3A61